MDNQSSTSPLTPHGIEEQIKRVYAVNAEKQCGAAMAESGAIRGLKADLPKILGLMENVHSKLYRAEREARNVSKLEELRWLLDKNPEVARILDLIEETR